MLLAFTGLSLPAISQTPDSAAYKNELGIITSPSLQYLFQNKSLPVGLIYKRQVKPDQAWRLTVNGRYNSQKYPFGSSDSNFSYSVKRTDYFTSALIGYEWQKELNKKWSLYYGTEAGAGFGKSTSYFDFPNYNTGQNIFLTTSYGDYSTVHFILQPLAGIKFKISSRLFVATETHIELNYSNTKQKEIEVSFNENQGLKTSEFNKLQSWSLNLNYSPLSNIQLVYQF